MPRQFPTYGISRRPAPAAEEAPYSYEPKNGSTTVPPHSRGKGQSHKHHLPQYNHNGHKVTRGIQPAGESGRSWFHPWHFLRICFRSSCKLSMVVNVLWPVVPAAIAIHFARPDMNLTIFVLNYIAMIPAANLLGFAGQELARKLPVVFGVILETTFGSLVEIVLFMVLIHREHKYGEENAGHYVQIIRAAILGSILANMLLALGACFLAGGIRRKESEFHDAVSEVGTGLMLVAGFGLVVPTTFATTLSGAVGFTETELQDSTLKISRATACVLLFAFVVYVFFQARSHHGIYEDLLAADEEKDHDRHKDLQKDKLTFTECIIAILIALTCVSLIAVFLVEQIEFVVNERHVSDAFVGLILIPLVEKAAEHITAIDEAWDNQMNFALSHVLGASIQTALLNAPLVVIVGWGLDKGMDFNFEAFDAIVLILAVLVIGNFLRDGKSNYLEGVLCVLVYLIIAITAFYYPDPQEDGGSIPTSETSEGGAAHRLLRRRGGF